MITTNFEDFPEHRLKFFALLHAITNHCFKCLFGMSPPQLKLLIDSIIWAFRHTERNVAETGLLLLEVSILCNVIPFEECRAKFQCVGPPSVWLVTLHIDVFIVRELFDAKQASNMASNMAGSDACSITVCHCPGRGGSCA